MFMLMYNFAEFFIALEGGRESFLEKGINFPSVREGYLCVVLELEPCLRLKRALVGV